MADVYRHSVVRSDGIFVPNTLIDLVNGEDTALVFNQKQQNTVLNGSQLHRLPVHSHLPGVIVDHKSPHLVQGLALRVQTAKGSVPAQIGLHPGGQFQGVKGFGDIVIRPNVQPQNLVRVLGLGGENNDGDTAALPNLKGCPDTVQFRHHNVHDQQVNVLLFQHLNGLFSVVGLVDMMVVLAQIDLYGVNNFSVIVAYKYIRHNLSSLLS